MNAVSASDCRKSLCKIRNNIVDMFKPDRESDHLRRNAGFLKLLIVHLSVCVARRVQYARPRIRHMGYNGRQLQMIHHFGSGLSAAF